MTKWHVGSVTVINKYTIMILLCNGLDTCTKFGNKIIIYGCKIFMLKINDIYNALILFHSKIIIFSIAMF